VAGDANPPLPAAGTVTVTFYGVLDGYGPEDTMANGERFDPYAMTAATNLWPLGTRLRVCVDADCVGVTVTDRCGACSLDLSYGAFGALAPHSRGVLAAAVEVVG